MILLVVQENAVEVLALPESQEVCRMQASSIQDVIDRVEAHPVDRVVLPWPPGEVNPFALARTLRLRHGPPVTLAGRLRPDTRFWAERNGCQVIDDLETCPGMRGRDP